jgi:hypothetical protein
MLILAATVSLLWVLLPLVIVPESPDAARFQWWKQVATSGCVVAITLMALYPFAILGHYRLLVGESAKQAGTARTWCERDEGLCVFIALTASVVAAYWNWP